MKLNSRYAVLAAALAGVGFGTVAAAQNEPSTANPATTAGAPAATGRHWHRAHGSMLLGTMLRATRQLNLTPQQKQSIRTLLTQARNENKSNAAAAPDVTVLGNPGDAGYATAVQNMQTRAASRIQLESALAANIYKNVLTDAQRQALPGVLADMKTQMQQRRANWLQQHPAANAGS